MSRYKDLNTYNCTGMTDVSECFFVKPTDKVIRNRGPRFRISSKSLEKPGIELTIPGLQYTTVDRATSLTVIRTSPD